MEAMTPKAQKDKLGLIKIKYFLHPMTLSNNENATNQLKEREYFQIVDLIRG